MTSGKGRQARVKREVSYEEAMNQAFSEIFQNLKMIKEDTKKQREKVALQRRRRVSAPAASTTKTTSQQPKIEPVRKLSAPTPSSTLSTAHWVLQCFEEEAEGLETIDFNRVLEDRTKI